MGFDYKTSTGLGKQTLGGHKQNLGTPGARRKEQCPTRNWIRLACYVWQRYGSTVACCSIWDTEYKSGGLSPFEGAPITIITPTIVWPQAKTQSCPSTENWIKDLLSVALPIRTRPSSPTVSLSNQETFPQASYPYPSEGRQNENHSHRKLTKLITWTTALSNSMKLWAMPCRATQDGQVIMESSDKMWSTGEGNGKPLQHYCLENPMNSMKRQKDMTLKMDSLGW